MYYIGMHTYRLGVGDGVFATGMLTNRWFGEGVEVAVPRDLLDRGCIPLRLWMLRRVRGDGVRGDGVGEDGKGKGEGKEKWRLVGKALMLGEGDLMGEVGKGKSGVVELKRTIVCG